MRLFCRLLELQCSITWAIVSWVFQISDEASSYPDIVVTKSYWSAGSNAALLW